MQPCCRAAAQPCCRTAVPFTLHNYFACMLLVALYCLLLRLPRMQEMKTTLPILRSVGKISLQTDPRKLSNWQAPSSPSHSTPSLFTLWPKAIHHNTPQCTTLPHIPQRIPQHIPISLPTHACTNVRTPPPSFCRFAPYRKTSLSTLSRSAPLPCKKLTPIQAVLSMKYICSGPPLLADTPSLRCPSWGHERG